MSPFKPAVKSEAYLRIALVGPSGSGKTWTSLELATGMQQALAKRKLTTNIAFIDTERKSSSLYANNFKFDNMELVDFHPQRYIEAINEASRSGYKILVIDSMSHAWTGKGGLMEVLDKKKAASKNQITPWKDITPIQHELLDSILQAPMHVIACMRAKTEWDMEAIVDGKKKPVKIGSSPVQRPDIEYEFTIVGDLTMDHDLSFSKTRASFLDGRTIHEPSQSLGVELVDWLHEGSTPAEAPSVPSKAPIPQTQAQAPAQPVQAQETAKKGTAVDPQLMDHLRGLLLTSPALGQLYSKGTLDERAKAVGKDIKGYFAVRSKEEMMAVTAHALYSALTSEQQEEVEEEIA